AEREPRESLAPRRRTPMIGSELSGPLEMLAHPDGVAGQRAGDPSPQLHLARAMWCRRGSRNGRCPVEPFCCFLLVADVCVRHRETPGRGELEQAITHAARRLIRLLAARQSQ